MLGRVIFRYLVVSAIAVTGLAGLGFSQEMPTVPSVPEDEELLDDASAGEAPSIPVLVYTDDVDKYINYDWRAWNSRVRAWYGGSTSEDGVGAIVQCYPPAPRDALFFVESTVEELCEPFTAITNDVQAVDFHGVPTWTARVRETVDEFGVRSFETTFATSKCHQIPVSQSFDARVWVLKWFTPDCRLPNWLQTESQDIIDLWFDERDRARFGFSVTFVPPGMLTTYTAKLEEIARAEAERNALLQEQALATLPPLRVTDIDVAINEVSLSYYNQTQTHLGLLTARSLTQDPWDLWGEITGNNEVDRVKVALEEESEASPKFFRLIDFQTDTDGDRLPDLLEKYIYKTDPEKYDTSGSGMSDWEKVILHGLDIHTTDSDADELLDGEEVVYGSHPLKRDSDGDGIIDIEEIAPVLIRRGESSLWFESDNWTELYPTDNTGQVDNAIYKNIPLGFISTFDDYATDACYLDVNGRLIIHNYNKSEDSGTINASSNKWGAQWFQDVVFAGYWADLVANISFNSKIRYATIARDDDTYFVAEFQNMRTYSGRLDETGGMQLSFQMAIRKTRSGEYFPRFFVNYKDVGEHITGQNVAIGLQYPSRKAVYEYTYGPENPISSGTTLILTPGLRTDPMKSDTDGDGLSDREEYFSGRYKTDPNKADTDGDGLIDGEEVAGVLVQLPNGSARYYTNPLSADSDDDGLPDQWEVINGLNPLNGSGDFGADGDLDGDGVKNREELRLGTLPNVADSDGDGLSDGYILGTIEKCVASQPEWTSAQTFLFGLGTAYDDEVRSFDLPHPITIAGLTYTRVTVDVNGVVYFLRNVSSVDSPSSKYQNVNLASLLHTTTNLMVALYWDNLNIKSSSPGNVSYGECVYEGKACFAIDYMGLFTNASGSQGGSVWMQLLVPYDGSNQLIVLYHSLYTGFDCASATIGVLQPAAFVAQQFSCDTAGAVVSGDALIYTLVPQSDPAKSDTDGDGIPDGEENALGTHPALSDSDADGLSDFLEVYTYHTNPLVADSDGDGLSDGVEVRYGLPPLDDGTTDPAAAPNGDWDNDGLSNEQEVQQGLNPGVPDCDEDGLLDGDEVSRGTNPLHLDSDGDDLTDGWEVTYGFNPLVTDGVEETDADPDNDGLKNWEESVHGTNPYNADTDGDGISDKQEIEQSTDPLDPLDKEPLSSSYIVPISFSIYGDYAAWEMRIKGQGEGSSGLTDARLLKHHMRTPDIQSQSTFRLRKGCSYQVTMHWLKTKEGVSEEWYCWSAQVNDEPTEKTYKDYHSDRYESVATVVFGEGFWAENDDGLLCAHTHMNESGGGNVAGGLSATVHIPDFPCALIPDYQRNRQIDTQDVEQALAHQPLCLWINDDDDSANQDYSERDEDIPAASLFFDAKNGYVDGFCDTLDFFPVQLRISPLLDFLESREDIKSAYESGKLSIKLSHMDGAVNVIWTSLSQANSGSYLTQNIENCGEALDKKFLDASPIEVSADGIALPEPFIDLIRENAELGIILVEGRKHSTAPLVLGLYYNDDTCVWKTELPLNVLSVEAMYGHINLRDTNEVTRIDATIGHYSSVPNVLFLHGFNVSEDDARGWHAEMYKRLYQAGLDMNFYGVTWLGDEALTATIGFPALHYHRNVYNALKTSNALATAVAQLPQAVQTSILAHSLGNMVVSEAICSYGLKPDKYILLNAAIPVEAFDATLQDATSNQATLVPQDWRDYDSRTYAARWNELFTQEEPQSRMKWAGFFGDIAQKSPQTRFYNVYSSGDEVFELQEELEEGVLPAQYRGVLYWEFEGWSPLDLLRSLVPEPTFGRYAWQKQEFLKGTNVVFGTADGGWAFAMKEIQDPVTGEFRIVPQYSADEANAIVTNATASLALRQAPAFSATSSMLTPSTNVEQQRDELYEILAYRIPALSPAMGQYTSPSTASNINTTFAFEPLDITVEWPRSIPQCYANRWLHSDIKNMAFRYVNDGFRLLYDILKK